MSTQAPVVTLSALLLACAGLVLAAPEDKMPNAAELQKMTARFAPVEIGADVSGLPDGERRALAKLIDAAMVIDGLFLEQVWAGNTSMLLDLVRDETPLGRARLHAFLINKGPWSRLDHHRVLVPGAPPKPEGANFYPAGAAKAEIEAWLATLPAGDRARASGFYTTIRRGPDGALRIVPYSVEYQGALALAAGHLQQAAELTAQPTLKRFLASRAEAFLTDDYYASDVAWMELDATIEPTIGPYEVYEDALFNRKAAFEAFVTLRDEAETAKLERFGAHLQELENSLPIDPAFRNPKLGALAPIRVVNVVFAAGDGNRGVQTAAFNLPNDERVVREKGSKRVMLKNVQEAKFARALVPISKIALAAPDRAAVSFDAFFTHILMHELMHGLGPHQISVGGRSTTVRQELKELYSTIEEAKADISGLWALQQLADAGVIDASIARTMYRTFLASAFRSIRFGITEAHGRGMAIQLNWLLDRGAFRVNPDGTFAVDEATIARAAADLTREIMTIQAEGRYDAARELAARLGVVRPDVQQVLDRLTDVPVDIEPRFTTAEQLLGDRTP
jgi:hypothetical protein